MVAYSIYHFIRGVRNVGFKEAIRQIIKHQAFLGGKLVGTDKFGNRYYECTDKETVHCRDRYVEYAKPKSERDASQIPAEWHGWLHKTVEDPPNKRKSSTNVPNNPKFFQGHAENFTGTNRRYVPYSTTNPKIESWKPPPPAPR